MKSDEVFRRRY